MRIEIKEQLVCDFCNTPEIPPEWHWRLPAMSFKAPRGKHLPPETPDFTSVGDWGACNTCLPLVQKRDLVGLLNRCMEKMRHEIHPRLFGIVKHDIGLLQAKFFENWSGNVLPGGPPQPGDGTLVGLDPDERRAMGV